MLQSAVICVLDRKQSESGTEGGDYTLVLLVSPLVSHTSERCLVVALFFYFVCKVLLNIFSVYYSIWTSYMNVAILQKYSRNCMYKQSIRGHFSPPTRPWYEANATNQ